MKGLPVGIGESLQIASVIFGLLAMLTGYASTTYTDQGYIQTFKSLTLGIQEAKTRKEPNWTPYVKIKSDNFPDIGVPMMVKLQITLHSSDNTIPLMARIASDSQGHHSNTVSGPAAVVEQLIIEPVTYYVSVSDPKIGYKIYAMGWTNPGL